MNGEIDLFGMAQSGCCCLRTACSFSGKWMKCIQNRSISCVRWISTPSSVNVVRKIEEKSDKEEEEMHLLPIVKWVLAIRGNVLSKLIIEIMGLGHR